MPDFCILFLSCLSAQNGIRVLNDGAAVSSAFIDVNYYTKQGLHAFHTH